MRLISLASITFALILSMTIAGVACDEPQQLAANAGTVLPLPHAESASPKIMSPIRDGTRDGAPLQFCGQCTGDSDCGTDHKCCGPSSCRECFRVDTCP
ncbi:MAG TPA: hypothetical protein VMW68_04015 [Methyloceanibacter sp.]|nr:hypothetical protein [Methyloceanibacter sp.]